MNKTYQELLKLDVTKFDKGFMYQCTDQKKDNKYAVASLSLYSLVNAFKRGTYQVKTTSMDMIVENKAKFSPFSSHVESTYLLT